MGKRERDEGRRAREEEGRAFVIFEPGGNPPDPPLQAWLAGGGQGPGPVMQKTQGSSRSGYIPWTRVCGPPLPCALEPLAARKGPLVFYTLDSRIPWTHMPWTPPAYPGPA